MHVRFLSYTILLKYKRHSSLNRCTEIHLSPHLTHSLLLFMLTCPFPLNSCSIPIPRKSFHCEMEHAFPQPRHAFLILRVAVTFPELSCNGPFNNFLHYSFRYSLLRKGHTHANCLGLSVISQKHQCLMPSLGPS